MNDPIYRSDLLDESNNTRWPDDLEQFHVIHALEPEEYLEELYQRMADDGPYGRVE